MRFLILLLIILSSHIQAVASETGVPYSRLHRFGLRLGGGVGAYTGAIDNTANRIAASKTSIVVKNPDTQQDQLSVSDYTKYLSAGWLVPVQLEMSYGLTNAFQLLLGLNYVFSNGVLGSDDKYIFSSVGAALGYRYYFNDRDWIQPYVSSQLSLQLTEYWRLDSKTSFGFLWTITDLVGIFSEASLSVAGLYNGDDSIGKGVQLGAFCMTGVQLNF